MGQTRQVDIVRLVAADTVEAAMRAMVPSCCACLRACCRACLVAVVAAHMQADRKLRLGEDVTSAALDVSVLSAMCAQHGL